MMFNLIERMDLFGQNIDFKINGQSKSKTLFGGILSMLMIILLIVFLFISSEDVLYRKNPQIAVQNNVLETIPEIISNKDNFPVSVSLTGNSNDAINKPEYFRIKFYIMSGETSTEIPLNELNTTFCK